MSFVSQNSPRTQLDATKQSTVALPIISATVNTVPIDLEAVNTGPALDQVCLLGNFGAANANSGNAAVISLQLMHSDTNVGANFVNVPGTGPINIASNGATYPANSNIEFAKPSFGVKRFVQVQLTQGAGGANSANAANFTFSLGF